MALTFTSGGTQVVNHGTASSSHDNLATLTCLMWVNPSTVAVTLDTLLAKGLGAAGNRLIWRNANSVQGRLYFHRLRATTATVYETNTDFYTASAWQFLGVTFDTGAGAGEVVNMYRGTLTSGPVEATYASTADGSGALTTDAADSLLVGNLGALDEAFGGSIAWVGLWNRVLTTAEITQQQFRPRRTSGCILFSHYGLVGTGTQPDWSGTSNTGAVTGATVVSHVPLANLFAMGGDDFPYAVGGTLYTQSVAGTLTSAGATIKATAKTFAGTLTSAGATIKATAKAFVGTLTSAGTLAKEAAKTFAGTLTSAGTLTQIRTFLVTVAGTLTSAGTIAKETGKTLSGTLTTAGTIAKAITKSFAGTLTSSGDIIKSTAKAFTGTLTSSGALTQLRTFLVTIVGTLTSSGAVTRSTNKIVAGTLTTAGAINKAISKAVAGALSFVGTLLAVLAGSTVYLLDVELSDSAVTTVTLANSAVTTLTVGDAAVYAVTLSDTTRS